MCVCELMLRWTEQKNSSVQACDSAPKDSCSNLSLDLGPLTFLPLSPHTTYFIKIHHFSFF